MKNQIFALLFLFVTSHLYGQNSTLEGYVFESNNRGYLNQSKVECWLAMSNDSLTTVYSDTAGHFSFSVPASKKYILKISKDLFYPQNIDITAQSTGGTEYVKVKMKREPGYIFDVLLSEKAHKDSSNSTSISGARIEVYNNTTKKEELVLIGHPQPEFRFTFKKGNHYTLMLRKNGYISKRMEIYVNVKDCIICFEGVGTIRPNVLENLTQNNEMGTLLAYIEMDPVRIGSTFKLENIHYDYNKSFIREDAAIELDKLVTMLNDNPNIDVELGAHTDSRGRDSYNFNLSAARAIAAVEYVVVRGRIDSSRIKSQGYGESHILNKCKNGIKCSDSEHEENRRTEIKILGINDNNFKAIKSLKQIITEENFLKMVMNGEHEELNSNDHEDMPEDLKKYIESQKKKGKGEVSNKEEEGIKQIDDKSDVMVKSNNFIPSVPEGLTAYLVQFWKGNELKEVILSKAYRKLEKVYMQKEENEIILYTGPIDLFSYAKKLKNKLRRKSVFNNVKVVLFKDGKKQ